MKRVFAIFVFALTMLAVAQPQTTPDQNQANVPTSQKVIKDPAEYNAYMAALNTADPTQKAAAMETFITQYPQSVVKIDALEQAMAAYQQAGNRDKVEDTAKRVLAIDANNVRALAIIAFLDRARGTPDAAKEGRTYAERGLQALPNWQKPEGMSDAEFQKLRDQMSAIFNGAVAFGALQSKDYTAARDYYLKSDLNDLQNVYQLAVAELEMSPVDLNGFWHVVKAANLAQAQNNAAGAQQIAAYGKAKYKKYHGTNDGWDPFAATVATQTAPPALDDLKKLITPAPTPAEIACKAAKENDPATLSFADKEFILQYRDASPCNKEGADKVWKWFMDTQKGGEAKLKIEKVKVISANGAFLDVALTEDNQQANKADMHVILEKTPEKPILQGTVIDVVGVITEYSPDPFFFTMQKGELPGAKPPVKKPPVRRSTTKKRAA